MKFVKKFIRFSAYLLVIIFILILISIPYYLGIEYGQKPTTTEFWLQYLAIFLSTTSFGAIIVTLWIQFKSAKLQQEQITVNFDFAQQNYDSHVLNMIEQYMGESMKDCRYRNWILRADLKESSQTESEIFEIFTCSIKGHWGSRENANKTFNSDRFKDYSEFIKLIRYFDVLSYYSHSKITINAIHYYYIFYRPFFTQMIRIYTEAFDKVPSEQRVINSKHGWVNYVERMDKIIETFNLPLN